MGQVGKGGTSRGRAHAGTLRGSWPAPPAPPPHRGPKLAALLSSVIYKHLLGFQNVLPFTNNSILIPHLDCAHLSAPEGVVLPQKGGIAKGPGWQQTCLRVPHPQLWPPQRDLPSPQPLMQLNQDQSSMLMFQSTLDIVTQETVAWVGHQSLSPQGRAKHTGHWHRVSTAAK